MHKVVRLDEKELQQLTMEVKETVAHQALSFKKATRKFTAAQMWNVKRRMRSASLTVPQIRVVD
jgi:hypothetical protein